tara:strand:- start:428 stop:1399 length:972 start_codon:yes stop_codon:yes gene_type:complete
MKCLICEKKETVNFQDKYKLEIFEDEKFFENIKIYRCKECDFGFVHPIPSENKLNYFYENVYRSDGRPPYLVSENFEDQKKHYLEDKNLSYLIYLTTLIDLRNIKRFYDFGGGDGDLGYALKKKFPQLDLFCTEHDLHCEKILNDRGFKNLKNFNLIDQKFDLIVATHSLEHITNVKETFKKFYNLLKPGGYIFFEVPNCSQEYWSGRPYDSPHLLFYTKKSFEKIARLYGFEFVNFSYSAYSFEKDHKYQKDSQNNYYSDKNSIFSTGKLKRFLKKIIPKKIISFRQDLLQIKNLRSDIKLNWFVNNTGDNCYIRGILKKDV